MAKKNTEPKFRVVRLALSNDAYANLEAHTKAAKARKFSRSRVMTELLEYVDCPLAFLNIVETNAERRIIRAKQIDVLEIRRKPPEEWRTENKGNNNDQ